MNCAAAAGDPEGVKVYTPVNASGSSSTYPVVSVISQFGEGGGAGSGGSRDKVPE